MQVDWITEKSYGKYAKNAAQEELNSFYGIAKSMRDSGMEYDTIAENLKTLYGATPEQVEMVQKEVLGKTADIEKSAIKIAHWEIVVEDTINNDREVGRDYVETNSYEQAYNYAFNKFGTKDSSRYRVTINSYNTLF